MKLVQHSLEELQEINMRLFEANLDTVAKYILANSLLNSAALIIIVLYFLFVLFRKNKDLIFKCKHSLILLPDSLLISNPYIGKFFNSSLKF
jgi:hypothetical protein